MRPPELHFPAEPVAPALARAGVIAGLPDLPEQTVNDLALLTSELVSNAVRHASAPLTEDIVVRIDEEGGRIHVAVHDAGMLFSPPAARRPLGLAPSGWGLFLLDRVADGWGVEAEPPGKTVWFEINRPRVTAG